ELPRVELLVDHDHARAVPGQRLHRVTAFAHEHEQRARSGLCLHLLANESPEPLIAESHVHRLQRHVDRDPVRDHFAPALSEETTSRRSSESNPASTRTSAPPTSIAIAPVGRDPATTSLANFGAPA